MPLTLGIGIGIGIGIGRYITGQQRKSPTIRSGFYIGQVSQD